MSDAVEKFLHDFGILVPEGVAPIVVDGAALLTLGKLFAGDARFGPAHPIVSYLVGCVEDVVVKGALARIPSGAPRPRINRLALRGRILEMMSGGQQ